MSAPTLSAELAFLCRSLKAPSLANALPRLAERARSEAWPYERFAEALLAVEVQSREAHGGEGRIRAARFPARKTLEEFDFSFVTSVKKTIVLHLGQLDFLAGKENVLLLGPPARYRQDAPGDRARDPRLSRRPPRAVRHGNRVGRVPAGGKAPGAARG